MEIHGNCLRLSWNHRITMRGQLNFCMQMVNWTWLFEHYKMTFMSSNATCRISKEKIYTWRSKCGDPAWRVFGQTCALEIFFFFSCFFNFNYKDFVCCFFFYSAFVLCRLLLYGPAHLLLSQFQGLGFLVNNCKYINHVEFRIIWVMTRIWSLIAVLTFKPSSERGNIVRNTVLMILQTGMKGPGRWHSGHSFHSRWHHCREECSSCPCSR